MKFLNASLALVLCCYLPQPAESRPVRLRSDDNEVPEAKSPTDILDPNILDPNNKGIMEARPDIEDRIPKKPRPKPNPCCEGDDHPGFADPAYTEYEDCEEEEDQQVISRLKWAVRYLRAAVGSKPFESCLRDAVRKKIYLKTSHEHDWVGPYFHYDPKPYAPDPAFILGSFNSQYVAYDVVMNTARFAGSTSKRKLKLECVPLPAAMGSPSVESNRWDYDSTNWDQQKTHWIQVNTKERVIHAIGQDDWPEIFGVVGLRDYDNWDGHDPRYPVDEYAGMILGEMLHNIKIGNDCHYDIPCGPKSLNEIAEACVSEVVEESISRCHPEMCCHRYQVPIWVDGYTSMEGINIGDRRNLATDENPFDFDVSDYEYSLAGSCECESFW
jgi:hypothetical protein